MIEFDPFSKPGLLIRRLHQISVQVFSVGNPGEQLNTVQYGVLVAIAANPDIDQTSLASLVDIDRTSVIKVLDKLVDLGLVKREVCPKDRRARRMTLTGLGKAFVEKFDPVAEQTQEALLSPLSSDEQRQFMTMLSKLVEGHAGPKAGSPD